MIATIYTKDGPKRVLVCSYCRTVVISSGEYCSGHCRRNARRLEEQKKGSAK